WRWTELVRMREPNEVAVSATRDIATALGERLHAALLYGSVARGEHIAGISDINLLLLFDDIDADLLRRASPVLRPFAKDGLAPMLLEWDEWRRASDVFAIELLDMRDAHAIL